MVSPPPSSVVGKLCQQDRATSLAVYRMTPRQQAAIALECIGGLALFMAAWEVSHALGYLTTGAILFLAAWTFSK